jgi:hypothetical protein
VECPAGRQHARDVFPARGLLVSCSPARVPGSTTQTGGSGPWPADEPGSRGPPGSASAAGNRAASRAAGCSADTFAWTSTVPRRHPPERRSRGARRSRVPARAAGRGSIAGPPAGRASVFRCARDGPEIPSRSRGAGPAQKVRQKARGGERCGKHRCYSPARAARRRPSSPRVAFALPPRVSTYVERFCG